MGQRPAGIQLDLDPLSPFAHAIAAAVLFMDRAYPAAERLARRALDLQPDYVFALRALAAILAESGRVAEAIPLAERVVALSRAPFFVDLLGMVYGRAGKMDDLTRLERELEERRSRGEYVLPSSRVAIAIGRDDATLLRRGLEECLADHTPFVHLRLTFGPILDAFRTDVGIDELLQRLGDGVRPPSTMRMRT
jgi:tetratricopeptide (TPR) repeat protein